MTYRVAFAKRFQSDGSESALDPTSELDGYLPDGVVASKTFVERFAPASEHSQEVLDEDDAFLGLASAEVWEYDVVDERVKDFEAAARNSETVMELQTVDEGVTTSDEAMGVALGDSDTRNPKQFRPRRPATRDSSGVQGGDDGPAGQPTADPSAGGMGPGDTYVSPDETDSGTDGIDDLDLNVVDADDPNLGLTNRGKVGPDDWAADTGPTRDAESGLQPLATDEDAEQGPAARRPTRKR
jgi:hypothetical protein